MDFTGGCKLVRRRNDFLRGDDSWPPTSASGVEGDEESDDDTRRCERPNKDTKIEKANKKEREEIGHKPPTTD